jgi:hypothetical protein
MKPKIWVREKFSLVNFFLTHIALSNWRQVALPEPGLLSPESPLADIRFRYSQSQSECSTGPAQTVKLFSQAVGFCVAIIAVGSR